MEVIKAIGSVISYQMYKGFSGKISSDGPEEAYNVDDDLTYILGDCYYNACKNKNVYEKKIKKKLKVVIGSLGLNGHFEFGGKNWTANDFYKNPLDSHAWLEDDEGNVFDYIFDTYGFYAQHWNKKVTFPLQYEIVGVSKEELKSKYNLEYIKASRPIYKDICKNVLARYKKTNEEKYKTCKMIL